MKVSLWSILVFSICFQVPVFVQAGEDLTESAKAALRKAVAYFRENVSAEGGYLWRYSEDLAKREGEGKASPTTVWVQPPGTPSVGGAYLNAYEATGDPYYLEAAKETAMALVRGQLLSGGWDYRIEFDPEDRKRYAYRVDGSEGAKRNTTTLDDNTTQAALRYLMRVDRALDFKDEAIHGAVEYALENLLEAQYPNGAWPQRFSKPPDPSLYPIKKASYPESWSREYEEIDYKGYYTFNDNTISDMVETMLEAGEVYGDSKYTESAKKAGEFILLAQMPDPQPGWAQQYDTEMRPAWARKFEPPAISGGESRGVLQTLMVLYEATGDGKFLEPIPRALEYYRNSRLPEGGLARFYELETNKPLFFTKEYVLTYDDSDMPTHYGFKQGFWVDGVEARYKALRKERTKTVEEKPSKPRADLEKLAMEAISALDDRGRWVEEGSLKYHGEEDTTRRILSSATFAANVKVLSEYLLGSDPKESQNFE
jgi:PelA/Pel-15E family pectate lyase